MNLITTSICNKNCSFCFADGKHERNELSISDIKKIVEKSSKDEDVKLLGGEPTLYSNFKELLDYCKTIENNIVLISNFLIYKDDIKNAIKDFQEQKNLNFLLNVSETTEKQYQTISNNIKELVFNKSISLGFTLDKDRSFENYKIWLDRFMKDVGSKIKNIRVSVPFPNFKKGDKKEFYLYKNYTYTDLMEQFIKWGMMNDIFLSIDCGLFPCMFRSDKQRDYFLERVRDLQLGCSGGAFDVFSNNKASLCYPGKDIIVDLNKYDNLQSAFNELIIRKRYQYAKKDRLPKECRSCEFLNKQCAGPCLGFLDLED